MSRAFVKENDLEHSGIHFPEKIISKHTNYVTTLGFIGLKKSLTKIDNQIKKLKKEDSANIDKKFRLEREFRYLTARINSAVIIDPKKQNKDHVLFSAKVILSDKKNNKYSFTIVGEDEADSKKNKISYISPLAKILLGNKLGDEIEWERNKKKHLLKIIKIHY